MPEQQAENFFGQSYAPLASGVDPTFSTGFEGMPFAQENPLIGMLANSMLGGLFNKLGYSPMGLGHDRNIYDSMQARRYYQQTMQLQTQAAEMDRESWISTMRGMARITGTSWGAEQIRASRGLSDAMVTASPLLAKMFPEMLDDMSGVYGSGAVMAGRVMSAGRYRIDPVTGRLGMDPERVAQSARDMFTDLYTTGGGRETGGLTAGRVGELYEQMSLRGMIPGMRGTPMDRLGMIDRPTLEAAALRQTVGLPTKRDAVSGAQQLDLEKLKPEDIEKMLGDSEVSKRIMSFDSGRVNNTLKGYVQAISAVRDIFGDMGRPNAPMSELINALEKMTNGSVGQINPARLDSMVRMTHNLATSTGLSMDAMMMLQEHASARAQQMGIEPIFGVQAAQGAAAFGGAYRAGGYAADVAWGKYTPDQLTQLDANLRTNAAGSAMANRFGLALRLAETNKLGPDTEAGQFVEALRNAPTTGLDTYSFKGVTHKFSDIKEPQFVRMFSDAGINPADIQTMLQQRFANRQYVDSGQLGDVVRREQSAADFQPWLGRHATSFIAGELGRQGIRGKDQYEAGQIAGQAAAQRILDMDASAFADDEQRRKVMGDIFKDELGKTEGGVKLMAQLQASGKNPTEFFQTMAESFKGHWDQTIRYSPDMAYLGNSQNFFIAANKPLQEQTFRIQQQNQFTGAIQSALSPLGRGSMMRRAVSYLQRLGENEGGNDNELYGLAAETLGGVKIEDVRTHVAPAMADLKRQQDLLETLQRQYAAATKPEDQSRISTRIRKEIQTLQTISTNAQQSFAGIGVDLSGESEPVTIGDTSHALNKADHQKRATELAKVDEVFGGLVADTDAAGKPVMEDGKPKMRVATAKERNERLDNMFNTAEGKDFAAQTLSRIQMSESVADKLLTSNASIRTFGQQGIDEAKTIRTANERLREMAFEYSDGVVEHLIAGRLNPSVDQAKAAEIRQQAMAQMTTASDAVGRLRYAQERVAMGDLKPEDLAKLDATASLRRQVESKLDPAQRRISAAADEIAQRDSTTWTDADKTTMTQAREIRQAHADTALAQQHLAPAELEKQRQLFFESEGLRQKQLLGGRQWGRVDEKGVYHWDAADVTAMAKAAGVDEKTVKLAHDASEGEARDIRLYQNQLQKLDARAQNMTPDEQKTIKQAEDLQVRQAAGATLTPAEQDIVDKAKPLLLRGGINSNTIATTAALRQNVRRAALRLGHVLDDRELADISRAGELEVQAAPALKNKAEGKELSDQEKHTLDELAATKGRIGDTATRLGVSVDDVRKLNIDERRGGVSVEDVIAAHKVYDYQSEQAKEQRDLIQKPGMDVATSLLDAYGMSVDSRTPEGRAKLQQLSAIMQTEHGREITASLVSGRKELLKVGREKGGIKDADDEKAFMQLYEEYENGGVKGREMFANKYGEAAVSRMELQAASGFYTTVDEIGKDGKPTGHKIGKRNIDSAGDVEAIYGQRLRSGQVEQAGRTMTVQLAEGQVLRIVGDMKITEDNRAVSSGTGTTAGSPGVGHAVIPDGASK